jgi:glucose-6-phosphate 1-dehydrogenase
MSENKKIPKLNDADIVIFGGQGDLAIRKIFPAICFG